MHAHINFCCFLDETFWLIFQISLKKERIGTIKLFRFVKFFVSNLCVHADFLSPSFSMSFFVLRKKTCTSFAKKTANQWKRRIVRDHFFYVIVNIDHYFNLAIISLNKRKLLIKKNTAILKSNTQFFVSSALVVFCCSFLKVL